MTAGTALTARSPAGGTNSPARPGYKIVQPTAEDIQAGDEVM